MKKHRLLLIILGVFLFGFALSAEFSLAQAEDSKPYYGWQRGRYCGWDKEKMLKLKEQDPEKFKEMVCRHREKIEQRLRKLKQEDPRRYRELKQRINRNRRMHLRRLKAEDPEKFQQMLNKRKEHMRKRLEQLKTKDPEKYEQVCQRLESMKEFRRLRKEDSGKAGEYLEDHPQLNNRLEDMRKRGKNKWERNYYGPQYPGNSHGRGSR